MHTMQHKFALIMSGRIVNIYSFKIEYYYQRRGLTEAHRYEKEAIYMVILLVFRPEFSHSMA
jgi:hypothetical protein